MTRIWGLCAPRNAEARNRVDRCGVNGGGTKRMLSSLSSEYTASPHCSGSAGFAVGRSAGKHNLQAKNPMTPAAAKVVISRFICDSPAAWLRIGREQTRPESFAWYG